jgi:hypothetical protein
LNVVYECASHLDACPGADAEVVEEALETEAKQSDRLLPEFPNHTGDLLWASRKIGKFVKHSMGGVTSQRFVRDARLFDHDRIAAILLH